MPPEDPSKLPDEPPDKSPLQSGQKSLPTDGETRSDELCPPPPDKSPDSSPDKSPVLPSKTGRPTDDKTRDDIIASYRERPNLSRIERAKIFSPAALYKRVRRIEAEGGIQLEPRLPPVVRAKRPPPPVCARRRLGEIGEDASKLGQTLFRTTGYGLWGGRTFQHVPAGRRRRAAPLRSRGDPEPATRAPSSPARGSPVEVAPVADRSACDDALP